MVTVKKESILHAVWSMLLSKDCLVTLRNEIHLRCDGSEVAAQLALIKRGCLVTSLGLSATKPVVKPPFPKSWSCCDGLLLTTGGKTVLYFVQTGRPGILPPLWGARFHPQTASFHRRNDWLESGSVLGSWQDNRFAKATGHYSGFPVLKPSPDASPLCAPAPLPPPPLVHI